MIAIILVLSIIAAVYSFLVIKCCICFARYKETDTQNSDCKISILVSAKNEEENIAKFIDCIKNQSIKDLELVLVDDNSTDRSYAIAQSQSSDKIKIIKNEGKGKKDALKFGLQFCTGKYILSTDADCFPQKDWAKTLIETAESKNADMIMAPVIIEAKNPKSLFQRLWQAESFSLITITSGTCIYGKPVMCNGGNIGYKSEFWKSSISEINKKYASGDDMFMMESAEKQKKKIVYAKNNEAVIKTYGVENLKQLLNQRARWVSKTGGYTEFYTLFFAFCILMGNLNIIASLILMSLSVINLATFSGIFLAKFLTDWISVKVSSKYYKMEQKTSDIAILELVYPYYVVASILSYLTRGFKWK